MSIDGQISFCNAQMGRVLMCSTADLIGTTIEKIITNESRSEFQRMLQDVNADVEQYVEGIEDSESSDSSGNDDLADEAGSDGSTSSSDANLVSLRSSEHSFPMLCVNTNAKVSPDLPRRESSTSDDLESLSKQSALNPSVSSDLTSSKNSESNQNLSSEGSNNKTPSSMETTSEEDVKYPTEGTLTPVY